MTLAPKPLILSIQGVITGIGITAHLTFKLLEHFGIFSSRVSLDDARAAQGPAPSKLEVDGVGVSKPMHEANVSYSCRAGGDAEFEEIVREGVEHALRLHRRREGRGGGAYHIWHGEGKGFSDVVVQGGSALSAGDDETLIA